MTSTSRTTTRKALVKGPNGRNLCRWCSTECSSARRTFCGPKCVHEYLIRAQPSYARQCVFDRDLGTCESCLVECGTGHDRYRRLLRLAAQAKDDGEPEMAKMLSDNARAWQWSAVAGEQVVTRMRDSSYHKGIQWDADHIVPVIEGGGECGLSNLRTLCRDCHKRVTAELAKRRALARRRDKESA